MFNLFKKKSETEILAKKYKQLMKEAHALSSIDRTKSDAKVAEAEEIGKQLDALRAQSN